MSTYQRVLDSEYTTKLRYPMMKNVPFSDDKRQSYLRDREAYYNDVARLEGIFRADLEAEFGMVGHPKADKLWGKAWEGGHSSGLGEVADIYADLVELVL